MISAQKQLINKFLIYKLLTNLWFVGAVWLYFYRIYITDQQIGILDGLAFAIGLIAEIPSGVMADKFGRDKMVKIGQLFVGSGLFIQAFGKSFASFVAGQAIFMIGVAFVSGADEALFFDKLQFKKISANWRKLVTRASQIALVATAAATIIGAWLYNINPRIPWYLIGLSFISSALVIWSIKEKRPVNNKQKLTLELKEYLLNIKSGFTHFAERKLFVYLPIIIIVQGLFYATGWGVLRLILLDRFYFSPFMGSLVIASSSLITVAFLFFVNKYAERISEKRVLVLISVLAAMSLLVSITDIGAWGYFVILSFYVGENVLQPFISEVLNYRTSEDQRATVLSVASFL